MLPSQWDSTVDLPPFFGTILERFISIWLDCNFYIAVRGNGAWDPIILCNVAFIILQLLDLYDNI